MLPRMKSTLNVGSLPLLNAVLSAPIQTGALLATLTVCIWTALKYLHGAQMDRLKQDLESERGENERLRNRMAEIERHGAPTTVQQKELTAWCREHLDGTYSQAIAILKKLEAMDPWQEPSLKRSNLSDLEVRGRFTPSQKIANANASLLAQEFLLDALSLYYEQATEIHDTQRYGLPDLRLSDLPGYLTWRADDANLLRALELLQKKPRLPCHPKTLAGRLGLGRTNRRLAAPRSGHLIPLDLHDRIGAHRQRGQTLRLQQQVLVRRARGQVLAPDHRDDRHR